MQHPRALSLLICALAPALVCSLAAPAWAQPAAVASAAARSSATSLTEADRDFLIQSAIDGMAEVELAKLAQQHASSPKVKEFAARMLKDHGRANGELKSLAVSKGVSLPEVLPRLQQDDLTQMGKLDGADFDKAYSLHMVGDHQKAVAAFEKQARGTGDAQIRVWAARTLPTLKAHLAAAQTLDPGAAPTK